MVEIQFHRIFARKLLLKIQSENEKFSLTEKNFVKSTILVKPLLSRNFCKKLCTAVVEEHNEEFAFIHKIIREIKSLVTSFNKNDAFTKFLSKKRELRDNFRKFHIVSKFIDFLHTFLC